MVELAYRMPYHRAMKRSLFTSIARQSASNILDSLDMRPHQRSITLRRGQTVESAWTATGAYLRKALVRYGETSPRTTRTR